MIHQSHMAHPVDLLGSDPWCPEAQFGFQTILIIEQLVPLGVGERKQRSMGIGRLKIPEP